MLDAKKAHDDLEEILKSREYRVYYQHSKGFIQTWWEKAKEWMSKQLGKWFPDIEPSRGVSTTILITMIVLVIIILTITAFLLIRRMKRNKLLRKQKPIQSLQEINWTFHRHLKEAEKLESLEDYAGSTRHLFLGLLLYYHQEGWLEARIWKTNWEYYDELRKVNQQNAEQFFLLAHFFDEVTYGERKVTKDDLGQFRTRVRKLLGERGEESLG